MSRFMVVVCCVSAIVAAAFTLFTDLDAVCLLGAFVLLGAAELFNRQYELRDEDAAIRNQIRKERMVNSMRDEEAFKMQLRREAITREFHTWDIGDT